MRMTHPGPCLLLFLGLLAAACTGDQRPVAFAPQSPPAAEVDRVREQDRRLLADYQPQGPSLAVVQQFQRVNRLTVAQNRSEIEMEGATSDMRLAIQRCLIDLGQDELKRVGLFLLAGFEHTLGELLAAAKDELTAGALLTGAAPRDPVAARAWEAFVPHGGAFLTLAGANGLLRQMPEGRLALIEGGEFIVRLAFKVYFANAVHEVTHPMEWMLDPFERIWYERWVIERSRTAGLPRRLQSIQTLSKLDPGYPAQRALGIVLFQAGRFADAAAAFQVALEAGDDAAELRSFLKQARDRSR